MKKLTILILLLVVVGCYSDNLVGPKNTGVDLGVPSMMMAINNTSSPVTSGPYSVTVSVTPGATYSLQLTHIDGTIVNNYGFTATSGQMTISLNYSTVPNGAYDLVLMDNTGRLLKNAVIIQH